MESLVTANVRQRPVRALVSAAGVALGVCLVMLFTGLARGMSSDLQRRASNLKAEIIFARSSGPEMMSTTASLPVRYVDELMKVDGVAMALPAVLEEIRVRDVQDKTRALAPLRKADDAIAIDTTGLTAEQVVNRMMQEIEQRCCT